MKRNTIFDDMRKEDPTMTRVALYGRYSSEGQREASIIDQARNCVRRAQQQGWNIVHR